MKVAQIGDWTLEDHLVADARPLVVFFMEAGVRTGEIRRYEFRRVAAQHPEARFVELNLLENPSLVSRYAITATPVVLVFVHGQEVTRHTGGQLETTIERVLGSCSKDGD